MRLRVFICLLVFAASVAAKDTNWWSLKPLVRPERPVDAKEPEADRRTLLRRLKFDLHGLLPTPAEVRAFVEDRDARSYEKKVDELLASPRYGERWARHWLDLVHYADTHGFEHDLIRSNAWRYRDYVIESFNRDTPWPRFIKEQLAADVFYPEQPELTPALGFIGAGPWDQSTAQTAPKTFDVLDRDDMVTQTMSAFASVTVHCARCHKHKFDPISQEDYYSLQAVFAGVGKGDIVFDKDLATAKQRKRWQELSTTTNLLTAENEKLIADWEARNGKGATWTNLDAEVFATAKGSELKKLDDLSFVATGPRTETEIYTITATTLLPRVTAARLEVLTDSSLPKNGPGRADNGNLHLSEISIQLFKAGDTQGRRLKVTRATADFDQEGWTIQHALDGNDKTAWGIHPQEGEGHVAVFEFGEAVEIPAGSRVVFQLLHLHGGSHIIGRFRLALTDSASAFAFPTPVAEALAATNRTEEQRTTVAAFLLKRIAQEELAKLPAPERVFGGGPEFAAVHEGNFYKPWKEPKTVHVLARGDIEKQRAVAEPGALSALSFVHGRFEGATNEGPRRAMLAEWLAHTNNPLTWRSIANRVWQHHFGKGLSDSPNDFGRMGSEPSDVQMLDWLACELRDSGGSLKTLHRIVLNSAAYKSAKREARRMDAETFRDNVLAIAGKLDLTMGGPGVQHFKLGKPIQLTPTVDYAGHDWDAPGASRRSIYRFIYRGLPDPFMDAMDFPDAAQLAPTRPFSFSALQSLALLNNDFVLHFSGKIAASIPELVQLAYQREATSVELEEFGAYEDKHGRAALARVILNSNEFLFID